MVSALVRWISLTAVAVLLAACNANSAKLTPGTTLSASGAKVGDRAGDLQVVAFLPEPLAADGSTEQRIGQNDLLKIDVFQVDDLDRTVRVDPSGTISMPLIGNVKAAGLTNSELERSLEAKYGRNYLQNPEITVFVEDSPGRRVTMDGEFRKPGIYPVTSQSTLVQAVALAGGLSDLADESKVYVYRSAKSGKKVANYSIKDIRAGKQRDPRIYGGDVIVSFTSSTKIAAQNLRQALGIATSATRLATPF